MDDRQTIFVYGTLRRGASGHLHMMGAERIGPAKVRGLLYFVPPHQALVCREEDRWVVGEVWEVDAGHLARLDGFHGLGHGTLEGENYRRVRATAKFSTEVFDLDGRFGTATEVWLWEWKGEFHEGRFIESGDWLDVEQPRQPPLFTVIGCVGVLAIPIGGAVLVALAVEILPLPTMTDRRQALLGLLAPLLPIGSTVLGWYCIKMIDRRREPGKRAYHWLTFGTVMMLVFSILGVLTSVAEALMKLTE